MVLTLLLIGSASLQAAQKVGDQLVFVKESGGASLRVGVEENVASVSLEYRKPGAKTWTSAEQADLMKQAITNQRKMDVIIDEMRNLSQKIILALPRKSMIRTTANRPKLPLS